jgi:predicted phosphodiesterase
MRAAVLSDLHVEFEAFDPSPQARQADLVILAGDIHNGVAALEWARRSFPGQRLVQVAGNHEFFGGCWQRVMEEMREAADLLDIHLLEEDSVVIDGVQFLGATMWTDFRLFEAPGRPLQMTAEEAKPLLQRRMIDFSLIRFRDQGKGPGVGHHDGPGDGPGDEPGDEPGAEPGGRHGGHSRSGAGRIAERVFTPDDSISIHRRSREWLAQQLATPFEGPRVVVSHHLPSWRSVAPAFLRAVSNASFASDLDELFGPVALWVHGHTHHSFDYRVGATRIVANPRGYPMKEGGFENPRFQPALLVDLPG